MHNFNSSYGFYILIVAIFCTYIWLLYRLYKYLKASHVNKYLKIRQTTIVVCLIITVLIPCIILTYYDIKRDELKSKAILSLNSIINNADSYVKLYNDAYVHFDEIDPRDNQKPNNQIEADWVYKTILGFGAQPYNGVYRCYNINETFGEQVIFAGEAERKGFTSDENPVLFHAWIQPYRIRYFSSSNINPNQDLNSVYYSFLKSFIWDHKAQLKDDIYDEFFQRSLNEYYEINHVSGGDEMWIDHKLYYENDIVQERVYEYKTINYGNFDITYCISRPCKLGICEKYVEGSILGKKMLDKIHLVKRYEAIERYILIWIILLCSIFTIFLFGNPSKK